MRALRTVLSIAVLSAALAGCGGYYGYGQRNSGYNGYGYKQLLQRRSLQRVWLQQ